MNIIGKTVKVLDASDLTKVGVEGKVIYETAKMLVISSNSRKKMVEKIGTKILVEGNVVDCNSLLGRLDRRIEKN